MRNEITYTNAGASQAAILDLVKDYLKYDAPEADKDNREAILADPDQYFTFTEVEDGVEIERKESAQGLAFTPKVFVVTTNSAHGQTQWPLLTVDGEAPNETVYFLRKGDAPSDGDSDQIIAAIAAEEWQEKDVEDISEFDINPEVFSAAGEGYAQIREALASI